MSASLRCACHTNEPNSGGSFDSDIRDLTVYNNNLIAGGQFANSPGGAADGIAQWNGTSWSALPGTTSGNAEIFSLTVSNGLLVAGGSFSSLGGVTATNIADWNGTAWSALAGPTRHHYNQVRREPRWTHPS